MLPWLFAWDNIKVWDSSVRLPPRTRKLTRKNKSHGDQKELGTTGLSKRGSCSQPLLRAAMNGCQHL